MTVPTIRAAGRDVVVQPVQVLEHVFEGCGDGLLEGAVASALARPKCLSGNMLSTARCLCLMVVCMETADVDAREPCSLRPERASLSQ